MKKFVTQERRQDAPPPADLGPSPPPQAFESQPMESAPGPPPKNDATWTEDPNRQRAPAELIPGDREQAWRRPSPAEDRGKQRGPVELIPEDRDPMKRRPSPAGDQGTQRERPQAEYFPQNREPVRQRPPAPEDGGKQRAPQEPLPEDREPIRQRPLAPEDQSKQRPPQEPLPDHRERIGQRPSAPEDGGKQRAPEMRPEDRDPNSARQRPSAPGDRGKGRAPAELLDPQHTERSPLFTRPSSPHPMYAAAGPSRGYDAYSHRQASPVDSDDIVLADNRTQPKPGFWARLTNAIRDRGDPELEPGHAHVRGRLPPQPSRPNVILFGSHGAGKSSLINMLAAREASTTSDRGLAPFANGAYVIDVGGGEVLIWDVLGLHREERHKGRDEISEDAARNLRTLIQRMPGGVNLLVHCINAKHSNEAVETNYEAFYRIIGGRKVPVVLVVTGLEDEVPMEGWWKRNEAELKNRKMTYDGHACVTTIRGKPLKNGHGHWYDEQYEQSRLAVRELIKAKLGAAVIVREEGKLRELRELLREQNERAVSQNGGKGKDVRGKGIWASREANGGHGSTQAEEWDDDTADRVQREGRTASLALLGGLVAVFLVLHSGITSCI